MGTWNTAINGNDTFLDIYSNFFDHYNAGDNPDTISQALLNDYKEMFMDVDDRHNSLFGLALAQWETKSLDKKIFLQVKNIIESGNDIKVWKGLGADEKTLRKRKIVLDKFLLQLSTEREKPKRRVRPKFEFSKKKIVNSIAPDKKKIFTVDELYTNGVYQQTGSLLMWAASVDKVFINGGGGSVLYFTGQGQFVSAKWLDSKTLELTHDKNIIFKER